MIKKIESSEISPLRVATLPTRPTAPTSFGGKGYSAAQMKEAFDRLPLFIASKLNELIDCINTEGDGSIAESIMTGLFEGHTLRDMIADVLSGKFSSYLSVYGTTLVDCIERMRGDIYAIKRDMGDDYTARQFVTLDCGRPADRGEGGIEDA